MRTVSTHRPAAVSACQGVSFCMPSALPESLLAVWRCVLERFVIITQFLRLYLRFLDWSGDRRHGDAVFLALQSSDWFGVDSGVWSVYNPVAFSISLLRRASCICIYFSTAPCCHSRSVRGFRALPCSFVGDSWRPHDFFWPAKAAAAEVSLSLVHCRKESFST